MKIILLTFLWIALLSAGYAGISAAPYIPTKPKQKRRLIERLNFKNGDVVYDLGCGTGTLTFAAAKKNPQIKSIGYEISIIPYLIAKIKSFAYKNAEIRFGNLFKQPMNDADTIFIFLLSKSYPKLIAKLKQEVKDDCRIVVEAWPLPNIEPAETITEEKLLPVYIYYGRNLKI